MTFYTLPSVKSQLESIEVVKPQNKNEITQIIMMMTINIQSMADDDLVNSTYFPYNFNFYNVEATLRSRFDVELSN